jgi:hypothetical protein
MIHSRRGLYGEAMRRRAILIAVVLAALGITERSLGRCMDFCDDASAAVPPERQGCLS